MNTDRRLLDKSERLTESGIGLLRVAAGLFFLIPGISKLVSPDVLLTMLTELPLMLQAHVHWIATLVTWSEIIGGTLLVIGWNVRLAVIPLIIITLVAELLVVANDTDSRLRTLSIATHFMGIGLYFGIMLLGHGRWAIREKSSIVKRLAGNKGSISSLADWFISGAGRNYGIVLVRVSLALPFLSAAVLGITDPQYMSLLPESPWVRLPLLLCSLLGGIAMLLGFQTRATGTLLALLVVVHFFTAGLSDLPDSRIGLINLLFHLLILTAVLALRRISFGSELAVEHILSFDKRNVVVVGGGFAGTEAARRLEKHLPQEWQVVLISEENYMTFNPMLAEVVGASVMPNHVIAPVRRMLRRSRFISAKVTRIDAEDKLVHFDSAGHVGNVPFEHLLLAFGSRVNMDLVPGMQEHALPFKLLGDALQLRNRVITQMEKADLEADAETRRWLGHFIVVGGGFSGIAVGGAILDFIRSSQKHYPRLHDSDLFVSIVHEGALPLPELSDAARRQTLTRMRYRGINMVTSTRLVSVDENGISLDNGSRIEGATVISSIGKRPNRLVTDSSLPTHLGQVHIQPDMRVKASDSIWAIGDCASIPNAATDTLAPPTARFAIAEGRQAADNIVRAINAEELHPFAYTDSSPMATIGHLNGLAEPFGKVRLNGFTGWLAWRAFYLSLMPTASMKTRIFFEWAWSMLFSPEIVNLRFTTTDEVRRTRQAADERPGDQPNGPSPGVS